MSVFRTTKDSKIKFQAETKKQKKKKTIKKEFKRLSEKKIYILYFYLAPLLKYIKNCKKWICFYKFIIRS